MSIVFLTISSLTDLLLAAGDYESGPGLTRILPSILIFLVLGELFRKRRRQTPAPGQSQPQPDPLTMQINEGIAYYEQGQYVKAEETLRRVVQNPLREPSVSQKHAVAYRMLALSCASQGKVKDAFGYCRTALKIYDQLKIWAYPEAVHCRQDLAWLHSLRGDFDKAEATLREIISTLEARPGRPDATMVATVYRLARLRERLGDLAEAERLLEESLQRYHESSWRSDQDHIALLEALSRVQSGRRKAEAAADTLQQVMTIQEHAFGPDHPSMVQSLIRLWQVYLDDLSYLKAEEACRRALAIEEKRLGPDHPATGALLAHLVVVLERQGRHREAAQVASRQLAILATSPESPDRDMLAQRLGEYAGYLRGQGRCGDADCVEYALVHCSPEYAWHVRPEQSWPLWRWN